MVAAITPDADNAELGRYEAQRRALGNMLSRFTADRDAMIASIQACEERVAALAARLDGGELPATTSEYIPADVNSRHFAELRQAVDELRESQQQALRRLNALADDARQRADEALRAVEAVGMHPALPASALDEIGAARVDQQRIEAQLNQLERVVAGMGEALTLATSTGAKAELPAAVIGRLKALEQAVEAVRAQMGEPAAIELADHTIETDDPPVLNEVRDADLRSRLTALEELALTVPAMRRVSMMVAGTALVAALGIACFAVIS